MISESPVVTVHIPPELRHYAGGYEEITASGDTVGEILEAVCREHPALQSQFLAVDGAVKSGIAVYLGPSNVESLQGLATPVALEELISIMATAAVPGCSVPDQGQVGQRRPLDSIKQVLDQQTEFGVAGDLEFAVEEQRVGVFLAGKQLEIGGEMGGKSEVGLAVDTKYRSEHAISIGE